MDAEKRNMTEQPEEEKVEPVKEATPKEEPIQSEELKQEEQAAAPKEGQQRPVVDLDYDKLAEAIVKANKASAEKQPDKPLNHIASVFSFVLGLCGFVFAILIFIAMIKGGGVFNWNDAAYALGGVFAYLLYSAFLVIVVAVSIWTCYIAIKIWKEPDRNYTVSVFSSLATFAALAVAILALLIK